MGRGLRVPALGSPWRSLISEIERTNFFNVAVYHEPMDDSWNIAMEANWNQPAAEYRAQGQKQVSSEALAQAVDLDTFLTDAIWTALCEFVCGIEAVSGLVGDLPEVRLWADVNEEGLANYLFHPAASIKAMEFAYRGRVPRPGTVSPLPVTIDATAHASHTVPTPPSNPVVKYQKLTDEEVEVAREMAKAKNKRVVVSKAPLPIDPNKVKRIHCNIHKSTAMTFDAMAQKWRCPEPGCKVVAKPVKDEDDRSVTVGRGGLSLRLVAAKGETQLLLISDDNVALNITPFLPTTLEGFIDSNDLLSVARDARDSGLTNCVDPGEKQLSFNLPVGIIGVDDLLDQFDN